MPEWLLDVVISIIVLLMISGFIWAVWRLMALGSQIRWEQLERDRYWRKR